MLNRTEPMSESESYQDIPMRAQPEVEEFLNEIRSVVMPEFAGIYRRLSTMRERAIGLGPEKGITATITVKEDWLGDCYSSKITGHRNDFQKLISEINEAINDIERCI